MFYPLRFLVFLILLSFPISSCTQKAEISEQSVARIIQTLSADDMRGRHAFDDAIDKAADFISNEFDAIGLSPLPGLESYHQTFTVYALSTEEASVNINGNDINDDYYFGLITVEEINWNTQDVPSFIISKDGDFRSAFRHFSSDSISSIILVDKEHKKWFHRYRSYFSRSNRTFNLGEKPNDVFILSNEKLNSADIRVKNKIKTHELSNIVGMIEGKRKDEIILFSAHYDHIGVVSPVGQDSIANGANDNASGVAAVIELARHFSNLPKPERTIYFAGFTAEESGGYGSKYFSEQLDPEQIVAMFNIEMIGKPALEGPNSAWITGYNYSTFGKILTNSVKDSVFLFYPDPYPNQNLFFRSDNATLAGLGVPAHSISTTPIDVDQDYHRVTDEFSTLHIPHATNTIRAIAKAAKVIISGQETPTRISPDILD